MKFFRSNSDPGRTHTHDGEKLTTTEGGKVVDSKYVSERRVRRELNVTEVTNKGQDKSQRGK